MGLKKNWIFAILATCCLMSILFLVIPIISAPTAGVYDPWIDTNDDGIINYQDLYNLASTYGTSGTPINKTDLLLELQSRVEALEALKVVAAGYILTDGTVSKGYNIESVTWNSGIERYEVSITGVNYHHMNYVTIVTPIGTEPRMVTTGSISNKLTIYIYDDAGTRVQSLFHFVTYEIS